MNSLNKPLPPKLSPAQYDKALIFAKLASKTYDLDDWLTARTGMEFFRGIDDIMFQDFSTPNYRKVGSGGNLVDWWSGKDQGLDYKIFQNKTTNDLVLAFRGTEPLSFEDWIEDAEQALGSSEQYEAAVKLAKDMVLKVEEKNAEEGTNTRLTFCGHSLGGGLATAAALATGKEAFAFDAAGLSDATIKKLGLDTGNASKVSNFNVRECFVSDWNGKADETTLGTVKRLGLIQRQYGDIYWLQSISERADFKGLPDDWPIVKKAETLLAHAWHVFTYQLERRNFDETTWNVSQEESVGPPKKKPRLVSPGN